MTNFPWILASSKMSTVLTAYNQVAKDIPVYGVGGQVCPMYIWAFWFLFNDLYVMVKWKEQKLKPNLPPKLLEHIHRA